MIGKLLRAPFRLARSAYGNAPGTMAITTAMAPLGLIGITGDPAAKRQARQLTSYYTQQIGNPGMTRLASVRSSQADLEQAQSIRRVLEKQASGGPAGALAKMTAKDYFKAGIGVGLAGLTLGAGQQGMAYGLGVATEKARMATREKQFRDVVKADPSLRDEPMAKDYFNVLHRASPYIASEPLVAAAAVRSMLETPEISRDGKGVRAVGPKMLNDLLSVESNRQNTRFPILNVTAPKGPSMKDVSGIGGE